MVIKPLYSLGEVAELIGWSKRKVYYHVSRGHLEATKRGRKWYMPLSTLRGMTDVWESIELRDLYSDDS